MYLPSGTVLNKRYEIQSVLGQGGFGVTYLALDTVLHVKTAVKEYLPRQLASRAEGRTGISVYTGEAREHFAYGLKKFLEEARSVAKFANHPNIVSARDYFEENGTAYMVMEYIEGVTFKQFLEQQGGRIPFELASRIMLPVMDALREVHLTGLLHRDISPDNVYLTTDGRIKLLDFGAARYFTGEYSKSLSVILKTGYAPEEQYRSSGRQGAWTDVYAAAATLYRAITGRTPPDALDRKEEDTLIPPSQLGVALPPAAEQALLRALAVNAPDRFQNMALFQAALRPDAPSTWTAAPAPDSYTPAYQPPPPLTPVAVPAPGPSYPAPPRRRGGATAMATAISIAIAVVVLGGMGVLLYLHEARKQPLSPATTAPPAARGGSAAVAVKPGSSTVPATTPVPPAAPPNTLPLAGKTAPRLGLSENDLRREFDRLSETLRTAHFRKDINRWLSCYHAAYPQLGRLEGQVLEFWKNNDVREISYRISNIQLESDQQASADLTWQMTVWDHRTQTLILHTPSYKSLIVNTGAGWKIRDSAEFSQWSPPGMAAGIAPPGIEPSAPRPPDSPAQGQTARFQAGSRWLIEWQSLYSYQGILQIYQQKAANQYLGRIRIRYRNEKDKEITVSMDGLLTIRGQNVVINCSNADKSWWDTDDFYLTWNNDTMTGHNVDKKGRRGRAVFRYQGGPGVAAASPGPIPLGGTGREAANTTMQQLAPQPGRYNYDNEAQMMVHNYLQASSANNINEILNCYDSVVNYFDRGVVTKKVIQKDKLDYFSRWPVKRYEVAGDIKVENQSGDLKLVEFRINFEVRNAHSHIRGVAVNQWRLKKVNNRLKIVSEKQQVLSREKL